MICLSVFLQDWKHAVSAVSRYGDSITCVELRCDSGDLVLLEKAAQEIKRPLLISCRSREHGGGWQGTENQRQQFLEQTLRFRPLYVDVELGTEAENLLEAYPDRQMMLSFHGRLPEPGQWRITLDRAFRRKGADVVRFVPRAVTWEDNARILRIIEDYRRKGKRLICHCSGPIGSISRMLAPAYGSMFTFCHADDAPWTAEGQIRLSEAVHSCRVHTISRETQIYGVVGNPVSHSRSPRLFNTLFGRSGRNAVYLPMPVESFDTFISFAKAFGIAGLSVTAPWKQAAAEYCSTRDALSERSGAANTLINRQGEFVAANTDGPGFLEAFTNAFGPVAKKHIVLLGNGGSARALAVHLLDNGASVLVTGRNHQQCKKVAAAVGARFTPNPEDALTADVVINTTSVSQETEDTEQFIKRWTRAGSISVDLHYAPPHPWFLQLAESFGNPVMNGAPMFIAQARRQYELFTGQQATVTLADADF